MTGAAEGAEVIPFERGGAERDDYEQAIKLWFQTRDTAEILAREDIGAMDHKSRMDAQRKALIMGMVHYLRQHERSDVALGVYLVLTLLSDNERGCATISQPSLAKLFNRSVSSIGDAQRRLKEDGLIIMGRGRYAGTYPVIPKVVAQQYNHMTWLVSALSDSDKPAKLPARPVDCQTTGQTGGLKQLTDQSTYATGGLKTANQPVEGGSINRPDPIQLHSRNSSTTLNRAASVVAGLATALGALPAAAQPPAVPIIEQPARLSLAQMTDRMVDAAGDALGNPAAHAGLLTYSELQRWLAAGCDFEGDILPAIKSRACRAKPGSLKSWSYFADAVADQKAIRERPMTEGRAPPGRSRNAPWEEDEIRRSRQADEAIERLKKKYGEM